MQPAETEFMVTHLFGDHAGMEMAQRIDRRVRRLRGLDCLHLVEDTVRAVNRTAA